ncbi:hypothetical protein CP533_6267 [Ophiocordyceps camponoti-saundersi (nom. inval.)]|nr:hypothetical protein CP533_6267 [Ophiocordyceps camponoti-saundersi (nom. inval.)]
MSFHSAGGPQRPYAPQQPRGHGDWQMPPQQHPGSRGHYDDGYGHYGGSDPRGRPAIRRPPLANGPESYPGPTREYRAYGDPGPDRSQFAIPGRSMTMPPQEDVPRQGPMPSRADTMPFHDPGNRGGVPPRPATATGSRPPPRRMHQPPPQGQPQEWHGRPYRQETSDDVFNSYFTPPPPRQPSLPEAEAAPFQGRGPPSDPRGGAPHQPPRLHHTKSEANFRGGGGGGFDPMAPPPTRGPSGHGNGQRFRGFEPRSGTAPPQMSSPDALPSHPTPVRPGLMANSMVSVSDRPPPVRNYNGVPQTGPPQPMQAPPPQHLQQQQAQQPRVAVRAGHQVPVPVMGQPVTPAELERLRVAIKHNANDQDSALLLARKLVEAADVLTMKMPDAKQRARMRDRYLMDAHKILKKLANAQNQEAMFIMADGLGKGLFGHEPDNKEAFALYHSAAKLGHAAAAYRTAVCCEIGQEEGGGTRKDPLKAMQWYRRAATLGDPPAMYKVGMIQLKGLLGQAKNPREAVGWLRRAAERANEENPHALHELGLLYESAQSNDVIIRDERYALSLFQDAADLGYKFSQFRLGCAFEYGLMGCPIDPRQSIYWYSRAAAQGEHQSELALSGWYLTGSEGVLGQSDTEAYLWARKAAVAGLAKAEYAMGYFTEVGIGVAANLEDAKRWYWRAAAQEFPKARERLEDLKRAGKHGRPRERERISRSRIERQQEGECSVM